MTGGYRSRHCSAGDNRRCLHLLLLLTLRGGSGHAIDSESISNCGCVQCEGAVFIRNVDSAANRLLKPYRVWVEVEYERDCRRRNLGLPNSESSSRLLSSHVSRIRY